MLALYCDGCHGLSNPSSGFRVTTFAGLRQGGDVGDDVVPGDPDRSMLVQFLEGRRGRGQQMPQGSRPLSARQIVMIRDWIKQGAEDDHAASPCYEFYLPAIPIAAGKPIEISCRISAPAFLRLSLNEAGTRRALHVEEASVNSPKELANIAAPDDPIHWTIVREQDWPSLIDVTLRVRYVDGPMNRSFVSTRTGYGRRTTKSARLLSCPPD